MKQFIATTILVLLTSGMLNTATAQELTPQEAAFGLTMLFAREHDALFGCPTSFSEYDACAQLSYSTLFMTRTRLDTWFRGYNDVGWLSGWVEGGGGAVVVRPFTLDDYPGELFTVAVAELGNGTIIVFEWADE